jgi:hypothetical protein
MASASCGHPAASKDEGHQPRQRFFGEEESSCGPNVGRIVGAGAAYQGRYEDQQLLPRLVVYGILCGLNIVGDAWRDAGPRRIDRAEGEPGDGFHHARRAAARGPTEPAGRNRPQRREIEPFRHCVFPGESRGGISATPGDGRQGAAGGGWSRGLRRGIFWTTADALEYCHNIQG